MSEGLRSRKLPGKKKLSIPGKEVRIPKKSRISNESLEGQVSKWPWLGVALVTLALGLVGIEDFNYRQERSSMLTLVEEWVLPRETIVMGRASMNASRSLEYRQSVMMGQGFLRASRLNQETAEESMAMARYHFKVALKQLGSDPAHERARLKLMSRIAEIEKALGHVPKDIPTEVEGLKESDAETPLVNEGEVAP